MDRQHATRNAIEKHCDVKKEQSLDESRLENTAKWNRLMNIKNFQSERKILRNILESIDFSISNNEDVIT